MATDYRTTQALLAGDAEFRAFVQAIDSGLLAAGGVVAASDTGQIDPATVAKPGAINTDAGFRMYRFNDAAQATQPVFIKLIFGIGASINLPRITFQMGTVTNGAGVFTGTRTTAAVVYPLGSVPVAGQIRHYHSSGGDGRISHVTHDPDISGRGLAFAVERLRLLDGTPSDRAIFACAMAATTSRAHYLITNAAYYATAILSDNGATFPVPAGPIAIAGLGVDVLILPMIAQVSPYFQSMLSFLFTQGGFGAGVPIAVNHMGAERQYMAFNGNSIGTQNAGVGVNTQVLMAWE